MSYVDLAFNVISLRPRSTNCNVTNIECLIQALVLQLLTISLLWKIPTYNWSCSDIMNTGFGVNEVNFFWKLEKIILIQKYIFCTFLLFSHWTWSIHVEGPFPLNMKYPHEWTTITAIKEWSTIVDSKIKNNIIKSTLHTGILSHDQTPFSIDFKEFLCCIFPSGFSIDGSMSCMPVIRTVISSGYIPQKELRKCNLIKLLC